MPQHHSFHHYLAAGAVLLLLGVEQQASSFIGYAEVLASCTLAVWVVVEFKEALAEFVNRGATRVDEVVAHVWEIRAWLAAHDDMISMVGLVCASLILELLGQLRADPLPVNLLLSLYTNAPPVSWLVLLILASFRLVLRTSSYTFYPLRVLTAIIMRVVFGGAFTVIAWILGLSGMSWEVVARVYGAIGRGLRGIAAVSTRAAALCRPVESEHGVWTLDRELAQLPQQGDYNNTLDECPSYTDRDHLQQTHLKHDLPQYVEGTPPHVGEPIALKPTWNLSLLL